MPENEDVLKESASIIEEVEEQLEKVLAKKRKEVEKELEEKIRQEREESKKRMYRFEEELNSEKRDLGSYRSTIKEYESNKAHLRVGIKNHLDKASRFQTEIEKLAGATLEELREVRELNEKLKELRLDVAEKTGLLKRKLEEKFGIVTKVPEAPPSEEKARVDLEQELIKLRKIKEILAKPEPAAAREEVETQPEELVSEEEPREKVAEEAVVEKEEVKAEEDKAAAEEEIVEIEEIMNVLRKPVEEMDVPEIVDVMDITPPEEQEVREEAPLPEEVEDKKVEKRAVRPVEEMTKTGAGKKEINEKPVHEVKAAEKQAATNRAGNKLNRMPENIQETKASQEPRIMPLKNADKGEMLSLLDDYRKTEFVEANGKIYYYQRNNKVILDGEKILASMKSRIDRAKKFYLEMSEKESPKDQFFLKQEIINNQELLRKLILRAIRKCEKESCSLPRFTSEVLSSKTLKNILEKLSIQNWSNEEEFREFSQYFEGLSKAFITKIIPYEIYLKSLLDQLK